MSDMQRYGYCSTCVCPLPKADGRCLLVLGMALLADAEAAVAAAEQRHADEDGLMEAQAFDEGERHMLAKCIAAVDAVEGGYSIPLGMSVGAFIDAMRHEFVAGLRALEEKP